MKGVIEVWCVLIIALVVECAITATLGLLLFRCADIEVQWHTALQVTVIVRALLWLAHKPYGASSMFWHEMQMRRYQRRIRDELCGQNSTGDRQ